MPTILRTILALLAAAALAAAPAIADDAITLTKRSRIQSATNKGEYDVVTKAEAWQPKESAIIVCDMWDLHHCYMAVERVKEMAPRMNEVLEKARAKGVLIVHAPSSCMDPYKDHPGRKLAQSAPQAANLPKEIAKWCYKIPSEEQGKYPIDQSDGGEDDEPKAHAEWAAKLAAMGRDPRAPWKTQYDVLKMHDADAISDSGVEIWNLLEARGIKNVILVGVHTNMCVLGRPFGLRQMAQNGKNVVLMRDMTDTMYNPARWPYVSHYRGTDLIIEHIEKFVCPTVTSDQILGGQPFVFAAAKAPRIVIAVSEPEYKTKDYLPPFAAEFLAKGKGYNVRFVMEDAKDSNRITGFGEALADCDLLLLSIRRRALPASDIAALKAYIKSGKPIVAIRTSSHAFDTKGKHPESHDEWPEFDKEILGGNYQGHHGNVATTVTMADGPGTKNHPILNGFASDAPYLSQVSLYKNAPLQPSAKVLLMGEIPGKPPEPVAWTNEVGKSRIFYTSLSDFTNPRYAVLLANAVDWALGK